MNTVARVTRGAGVAAKTVRERTRPAAGRGRVGCGMHRRGSGWDDAAAGSLFTRPKEEVAQDEDYATRDQARAGIFGCIGAFYSRARGHSSPGYVAPAEYGRPHDQTHR